MRWTIPIGRMFGIKILLHYSFFLIIFVVLYTNYERLSDIAFILEEIGLILALFFCVVLHELGHALAARGYGIQTRKIVLLPIGGVAQLESIPEKPSQELWIATAGPLVNVGLAIILSCISLLLFPSGFYQDFKFVTTTFIPRLAIYNLVLVLFNLIPAFPMDGGRILRALLAFRINYVTATTVAARVGQLFAIGFVVCGFMYTPIWVLTGIFVFVGAETEKRMVKSRHRFDSLQLKDIMSNDIHWLRANQFLGDAMAETISKPDNEYLVENEGKVVGVLNKHALLHAYQEYGNSVTVNEIMRSRFPVFSPEENAKTAIDLMKAYGFNLLPVIQSDRAIGVIKLDNL